LAPFVSGVSGACVPREEERTGDAKKGMGKRESLLGRQLLTSLLSAAEKLRRSGEKEKEGIFRCGGQRFGRETFQNLGRLEDGVNHSNVRKARQKRVEREEKFGSRGKINSSCVWKSKLLN